MITLKTGVPGSGKTLSMVAELQKLCDVKEGQSPRAIYTNISGLALPHVTLTDCTKWRECPSGSLIVIDEAFLFGYDAKSASAVVPDYIRDLAVHRKDYSVDIVFIAQHPKLLHVALRRQVGRHQHYRRLFGWGRAVCYEWDSCQENLSATKTAVMTQFSYPKKVFQAYKSAELHTKPAMGKPWFVWLPVALIPAAVWAFPAAWGTLSGAMTGKGIPTSLSGPVGPASAPRVSSSAAVHSGPVVALPPSLPVPVSAPEPAPQLAGCIRNENRCSCFTVNGRKVDAGLDVCMEETRAGQALADLTGFAPESSSVRLGRTLQDAEVLTWMAARRSSGYKLPSEPSSANSRMNGDDSRD